MSNYNYGDILEREAPRSSRPTRSAARFRPSCNEDIIAANIGVERDDGDANPSSFPGYDFLSNAGIIDDFLFLINRVELNTYMRYENPQYTLPTKTFVESFTFNNRPYKPTVAFKIYDNPITLSLEKFCSIVGVSNTGATKKIKDRATELMELYRGVTNDDDHVAQHGKIRNIQLPAI